MQTCTIVFLSALLVNLWSMDRHRSLRCGLLVPEIAVRHLVGQFFIVILVPGFKEENHRFAGHWYKNQSWYCRCVLIIPWICPALSQHPSGLAERPLIDQKCPEVCVWGRHNIWLAGQGDVGVATAWVPPLSPQGSVDSWVTVHSVTMMTASAGPTHAMLAKKYIWMWNNDLWVLMCSLSSDKFTHNVILIMDVLS